MFEWVNNNLSEVLRWQLANPGADSREGPEIPLAGQRIWKMFLDLHNARAVGFGPCAIAHGEIEAWSRLHREPVRSFEIEIIRALDRAFLEHANSRAETGHETRPDVQSRPLSPALFDAVFG